MNGRIFARVAVIGCFWASLTVSAGDARGWGEFVEPGFPFVSATVDAREIPGGALERNLIVRGVVVFLGNDTYACYDTDLVRLGVVWHGGFLDYKSMATHTYYNQGKKNQGGQTWVSKPQGECVTATGLYAGGQGSELSFEDPRPPVPDPREIGRGPVKDSVAQWKGLHVMGDRAMVKYTVRGTLVREVVEGVPEHSAGAYLRSFSVGPTTQGIKIVLSDDLGQVLRSETQRRVRSGGGLKALGFELVGDLGAELIVEDAGAVVLAIPPSQRQRSFGVLAHRGKQASEGILAKMTEALRGAFPDVRSVASRHWPEPVWTRGRLGRGDGLVVDEIRLPELNPWKRQVRVADLVFLPDESAAVVTFDGDVWRLSNLAGSLDALRWTRIASGLHEPQSINHRDGKLFVYTRNGLIRLNDLNGDGEIDFYETFSNRFTQTAETREFPNDSVVARDGSFYLAKPGQQAAHQGLHNGSILHVSPDGRTVDVVASGFRQPYLGYRASTDLLTASDQQGHWVPTTPVHWVRRDRHYGFRPSTEVVPPAFDTTSPICWIPHRVVQSATSQVWVDSDKMGPLSGRLVCLDYYRANLMLVHFDSDETPEQGAVSGLSLPVDLPVLKGDVNPHDGWLYLSGFQIWGSKAKPWAGIRRVRYLGGSAAFPTTVQTVKEGIVLGFDRELDEGAAQDLANYHVGRWNYRRTKNYGSGYYKLNGEPGTDLVGTSGAVLSSDRRSVLVVVPDMKPTMQMEVVYRLRDAGGQALEGSVYATVHQVKGGNVEDRGFSSAAVASALAQEPGLLASQGETGEVSAALGQQLYQTMGCMACHSIDGSTAGRSGPTLRGVYGAVREFSKGRSRKADDAYIQDSILNPPKNILKEYATSDIGMPSYEGILSEGQIKSLTAFIRSLAR